jgi:outer membrane protein insertion porin family
MAGEAATPPNFEIACAMRDASRQSDGGTPKGAKSRMRSVLRLYHGFRGFWLGAAALLAAGLVASASSQVLAQADTTIRIEGNQRIDAGTIRAYFHAAHGGAPNAAEIDAALKALYATQLFENVRIEHAGAALVVTVVENPVISRLAFEGNRKIKDDELKKQIESRAGGPLWRPIVQQDVARIVEAYHRSGYFDASVEPKVIKGSDHQAALVFELKEGKKIGIARIAFAGNRVFGAERLKSEIKTGETNFLSFLLNNDIYDPDQIGTDQMKLRDFYLKHGYADVRIAAAAEFDSAQKGFIVTFTVDEGVQYRFGTVELRSEIAGLDADGLRAKLRTDAAGVFNAEAVQKTVEDISIAAARAGYPFAGVDPRVERDAGRHLVNLVYAVGQGPRRYVERINIRGNSKTQDEVIRRELDFAEGDAYNRALIARAERRLRNLGYFKTVKISDAPGSTPDRLVLNIDVEEQATGNFWIGIGYGQADGVVGNVSLGDANLLGTGDAAKVSLTYGQHIKGFTLGFTQPYILGSRLSGGADLYGRETLANSYQSYGSQTFGGTLRLGVPLTEELGAQLRYSLYNQRVSLAPSLLNCSPLNPPPGGCASLPIRQAALNGPSWVSAVGSTVTYNTLDDIRSPSNGFNLALNQDLAGLGGDVDFLRTTTDLRYYHEIADGLIGITRAQGGHITPWGGQQLPLMDGFFGGPQLVRGFAVNGFGPRDLTPGTTMDNVGGTQYWATTAELDAPVPLIPPASGLKLGVFADAGSLWGYRGGSLPALSQSLQVADSHTIRSSLGAGLIWNSPFGPIRADYAFPTSRTSYDVVQRFRFSAGGF